MTHFQFLTHRDVRGIVSVCDALSTEPQNVGVWRFIDWAPECWCVTLYRLSPRVLVWQFLCEVSTCQVDFITFCKTWGIFSSGLLGWLIDWLIDWCTFVSCRWTHNRFARVGGILWLSERWKKPVSMSTPPPGAEREHCLNVPRLRPLVLLIWEVLRSRWVWSIVGMIILTTEEPENLSHCHSVHHKPHMDWPGIEAGSHRCFVGD